MSKTSLSIQMLEILYSRGVVGIAELARILETNPRNIPEYKKELEKAGYVIDTIPGRYGGYTLNKKYLFPTTRLTTEEKEGLMAGFDYLLQRNDFMRKDEYSKAMAKITAAHAVTFDAPEKTVVVPRFPLAMPREELEERYAAMARGIADKRAVEMEYLSLSNEVSKHSFDPYKLFMYNNSWYAVGFDEGCQDFRYFRLNRIQRFNLTDRPFRVRLTYSERDFIDEFGMRRNGEWYPVKLEIRGAHARIVKERIYGRNQTVTAVDKDTTVLSVEMQNRELIVSFVLGMGVNCRVLEPDWLRQEIKARCERILSEID